MIELPVSEAAPATNQPVGPSVSPQPSSGKKKGLLVGIVVVVFLLLAGGAFGYMYVEKIGVFSLDRYTEETFFTNLLAKSSEITSSSYKASASIDVGMREVGAEPFTVHNTNAAEIRQKYQNDYTRAQSVSSIITSLNSKIPSNYNTKATGLPTSITKLFDGVNSSYYYYGTPSVTDPTTNAEYEYAVTDNGNDYALGVTFETNDAIKTIKRGYRYAATTTIITGMKVVFTKNSYSYFYLTQEPPKPFLVQVSDATAMIPTDMSASMAFSASSDWKAEMANWIFNIDAAGSFGDLTYKVNVDAMKKDKDYYFKINNIPSLFGGGLANAKGKWVKVTATTSTSTGSMYDYDELSYLSRSLPKYEESYKKDREKSVKFIKLFAKTADSEKLIKFNGEPVSEKIDGRNLVRYELEVRKEAILPFYTKLNDAVNADPDLSTYKELIDQGLVDYLKSDEFTQVFEYYSKNKKLTLWTDTNGFPAIVEQKYRVIPPATATNLKDKQVNLVFKLILSNINEPVDIKAPSPVIPIEDLIKETKSASYGNDIGGIAELKSNLSRIRSQAEIVYDQNGAGGYGKTAFPLGSCSQKTGTLFADVTLYSYITKAEALGGGSASCISKSKNGVVSSYAVSVPLSDSPEYSWCVDSTGSSKQIKGAITTDICK